MTEQNETLKYAYLYSSCGLKVFPCWHKGKSPIPKNGCYAATNNEKQLKEWFSNILNNIAIATGSGIVVIDLDNDPDNGKYGSEIWEEWQQIYGQAPDTWECLTGGGGRHLYFRCNDEKLTTGVNIAPGVDFRGRGGYVIAPPSIHASGKIYEWEASHHPEDTPIAEMPVWLHALLLQSVKSPSKSPSNEIPERFKEGERNSELFRLAASLRARGLSIDEMIATVTTVNKSRCLPPLSDKEIETICNSAGKYEKGQFHSVIPATETKDLNTLKPESNKRYQWNDIGNGNLFADWFKDIARFAPERKKWMVYDGRRWKADTANLKVMQLCKQLADALMSYALSIKDEKLRTDYIKHITKWQQRNYRETILKDAASIYPVEMSEFDTDPFILNCLNGTLNLRSRLFHTHKAEDMLSKLSGVIYDPQAKSLRWERFINEIMQSQDKAVYLQKSLGYSLTGDTSHECFFMPYGPTSRNGKGTLMETFMQLMGDYGRTATPDTIAQKQKPNGSGPSEDIARLAGARFINISEPDKKMVLSAALVKTLTGKDKITARFLNENSFEFYPQFKLWVNTNHLPTVTDSTLFSSGRVKIIPFEKHFTEAERDEGLKVELAKPENLSAVLNWCLEGLWLIEETGFKPPEEVVAATDDYRRSNDKISRFLGDEMEQDSLAETRTSEVYRRYQEWCASNGFFPENSANFKSALANVATILRKKPRAGGEKTTLLIGYRPISLPSIY